VRNKDEEVSGEPEQDVVFMTDDWTYAAAPATFTWREKTYTTSPLTGVAFTVDELRGTGLSMDLCSQVSTGNHKHVHWSAVVLEVTYVPVPEGVGIMQEIASRTLRRGSRPVEIVSYAPGLEIGAYDLCSDVVVTHQALPESGNSRHDRRLCSILEEVLDLDTLVLSMRLLERRHMDVALWDTCYSPEDPASPEAAGIARLSRGARSFKRSSGAWVNDPVDGRLVSLTLSQEKTAENGLLIERYTTNYLQRSVFAAGTSGLTLNGTGSNGSAIASSTEHRMCDSSVSAYSLKITSGTPIHAADLEAVWPTTASFAAGTVLTLSVHHIDLGGLLGWYLYRVSALNTSGWWDTATTTWLGVKTWNALGAATTWTIGQCKAINIGTSAATLQLGLGVSTTGTAGSQHWVGAAQLEDGRYATSIIATNTCSITRWQDLLIVENDHESRTWPLNQGSARFVVVPLWSYTDLASTDVRVFADATHTTSGDYDRLQFDASTTQLVFKHVRNGVATSAGVDWAPVAGTQYTIGCRWIGDEGDLDLADWTIDAFVDGTKGTAAVSTEGTFRAPRSDVDLRIGYDYSTGNHADSYYRLMEIVDIPLSDDEMGDL
jgi:hypothetical protein